MGIMDQIGSGLGAVGAGMEQVGMTQIKAAVEAERDARLSELRMSEDLMTRERNVAGAAAERERVRTEATARAEGRAGGSEKSMGLMASNAGLDDASYRGGDENIGVNISKGTATATAEDMAFAKGDYGSVMANQRSDREAARADRADARHDVERAQDIKFKEAELKLRQASEGRLGRSADLDTAIKQITLDNAKQVKTLRDEFKDATPERKKQINEEMQILTGKDNDKFMPVPLKDAMGNVTGYHIFDTKAGRFVEPGVSGAAGGERRKDAAGNVYELGPDGKPRLVSAAAKPGAGGSAGEVKASGGTKEPVNYNEAGYTSLDATISGAERGDAAAKAMVKQMLQEGGLTQAQKQRVQALN